MASEEEEEVLIEVEAVEAVYGEDCKIIQRFPPHIQLHIKPRTADDSSQQFVEAILELRAGSQYPKEPPHIGMIDSKGLDEVRQAHLITSIQEKVDELSSCLMLVALCEEAVHVLSHMNHPDGDCPLCLYPLVKEDVHGNSWPFMKLMSCYHCFHSKCIIKWWNWLQQQSESDSNISNATATSSSNLGSRRGLHGAVKNQRSCPVCRKVFQATDIEHVLSLVQTYTSELSLEETETDDDEELQHSELENSRRKEFDALLKLQEENNGLIEPKKIQVLLPGVFLPNPVTPPTVSTKVSAELQQSEQTSTTNTHTSETGPSRPYSKASTSSRNNFGQRKNKMRNPRTQNKQWAKKES
ncbi:hypothetical protein AQUCO_03700069v1 [Aquilegia coerulea]|uniref:RWD domain-containing protein n=1 Tax=Aquilegia coerulea TaxID=218851 RepID=A0A2G5CTC8_AQUCA|nr:hypothetical protein AQUCO_03700069v1 [Aquilegia coerulea]